MSVYVVYSPELYHHGIKGQKWGVRRYQNEDGSLTYEGKIRYARDLSRKAEQASMKKDITDYRFKKAAKKMNKQVKNKKPGTGAYEKALTKALVYEKLKQAYDNEYVTAEKAKTDYFDKLYKEYGRAKVNNSIAMQDLGEPGLIGAGIGATVYGVLGGVLAGPAGAAAGFMNGAGQGIAVGAGVKYLAERRRTGGSVRKQLRNDYKNEKRRVIRDDR